jgi:hypothetical protein
MQQGLKPAVVSRPDESRFRGGTPTANSHKRWHVIRRGREHRADSTDAESFEVEVLRGAMRLLESGQGLVVSSLVTFDESDPAHAKL